jgi:hypothetical protein
MASHTPSTNGSTVLRSGVFDKIVTHDTLSSTKKPLSQECIKCTFTTKAKSKPHMSDIDDVIVIKVLE